MEPANEKKIALTMEMCRICGRERHTHFSRNSGTLNPSSGEWCYRDGYHQFKLAEEKPNPPANEKKIALPPYSLGDNTSMFTALDERESQLLSALRRISSLEDQVEALRKALRWAEPLARIAMEAQRLARLQYGHHDIGAGRERNKTEALLGLYDSEVENMDQARSALSSSSEVSQS